MKTLRMLSLLAAVTVSAAVTGCWTDDDDEAPPPTGTVAVPVPDSAGTSAASFVSFLMGLAANDEASEPYTIPDSFAVPADETADVKPLG
jgi:hypothetical protein